MPPGDRLEPSKTPVSSIFDNIHVHHCLAIGAKMLLSCCSSSALLRLTAATVVAHSGPATVWGALLPAVAAQPRLSRALHLAPPFLVEDYVPAAVTTHRLGRMPAKLAAAREELAACRACPRDCGVDRLRDQRGMCNVGRHGAHATLRCRADAHCYCHSAAVSEWWP